MKADSGWMWFIIGLGVSLSVYYLIRIVLELRQQSAAYRRYSKLVRLTCRQNGCDVQGGICERCGETEYSKFHHAPEIVHGPPEFLPEPMEHRRFDEIVRGMGQDYIPPREDGMPSNVPHDEMHDRKRARRVKQLEDEAQAKSPHAWIKSDMKSVSCGRCGESEDWHAFEFPETMEKRRAFFKMHSLCRLPRRERDVELIG